MEDEGAHEARPSAELGSQGDRVGRAGGGGEIDGGGGARGEDGERGGVGDFGCAGVHGGEEGIGVGAGGGLGLGAGDGHGRGGAEAEVAAELGMDHGASKFSLGPGKIDGEAAAGFQAGDGAAGPGGGQGGEELEDAGVALHEHLGEAGGVAEVAVDLERRVGVEEIPIEAAAFHRGLGGADEVEEVFDDDVGVVAVELAGPHVDLPAHRPAGGFVAAELEGARDGAEEFGRGVGVDLVAGVETVEVGEVAMVGLGFFVISAPFLELAAGADAVGSEAGEFVAELGDEVGVAAEEFGGGDGAREEFADDGEVHRGALGDGGGFTVGSDEGVFGRGADGGDEAAVFVGDEPVGVELGGAFEERVGFVGEEFAVAGEEPVFPEVGGEPAGGHVPKGGGGAAVHGEAVAPEGGVVVGDPAAAMIHVAGGAGAVGGGLADEAEKGFVQLGEVGGLGGPVVHLGVDVDGVAGGPGRDDEVVPLALEIEGLGADAGAGDHEVAAVLKEEGGESGVAGDAEGGDAGVGGKLVFRGVAVEAEGDAVEERGVVGEVALAEGGVALRGGFAEVVRGAERRVEAFAAGAFVGAVETAGGGDEDGGLGGALDAEGVGLGDDFAIGAEGEAGFEERAFTVDVGAVEDLGGVGFAGAVGVIKFGVF